MCSAQTTIKTDSLHDCKAQVYMHVREMGSEWVSMAGNKRDRL